MTDQDIETMLEGLKLGAMAQSYRQMMVSNSSTQMTPQEIIGHMCLAQ